MPCHLKHGLSEKEIATAARRAGVDILGLTNLYAGPPASTGFLMGFAAYTEREIEDAVKTGRNFPSCLMPSTGQRRILIPGEQGYKQGSAGLFW